MQSYKPKIIFYLIYQQSFIGNQLLAKLFSTIPQNKFGLF